MTKRRDVTVLFIGILTVLPVMANAQEFAPFPSDAGQQGYAQQGYAPSLQGYPQQVSDPNNGLPPTPPPQQVYSQQQIDQLAAPIALYPDQLVSQILMASTYPLEIVEAQRWRQQNAQLTGTALQSALDQQPWDPSVKSLVPFPQVLSMLDNNLQWTEQLGDAFLASQPAMMDSVQRLRQKAQAAGNLASTPQQTVVQQEGDIVIQPANPQVVYVPYYNPTVVYGSWPYAAYPPYYFPPAPGYVYYDSGLIGFGVGLAILDGLWGWDHWDWHRHEIFVDDRRYAELNRGRPPHFEGGAWSHDPDHRHGVPYHSFATRQQFQNASAQSRYGYRGYFNAPQNHAATGNVHAVNASQGRPFNAETHASTFQPQQRNAQPLSNNMTRSALPSVQPRVDTQQHTTQQRSAPMFESFARGSDVHAQATRGSFSRASAPAVSHAAAPQGQTHEGGGGHGGGHER